MLFKTLPVVVTRGEPKSKGVCRGTHHTCEGQYQATRQQQDTAHRFESESESVKVVKVKGESLDKYV